MAVLKNSPPSYKRFQYSGGKQKQKPEKKKHKIVRRQNAPSGSAMAIPKLPIQIHD